MSYRVLCSAAGVFLTLTLSAPQPAVAQAAGTSPGAAPPAEEPPPSFDNAFLASDAAIKVGESVWSTQCRHCHGASAYPGKAPKLKPGSYTPDFIYDRVTYGFRAMPPWKDVFSVEERKSVVAYIKSDRFTP